MTLSPRTEAISVTAYRSDHAGDKRWLQVLLVWRGQPGWADLNSTRARPDSATLTRTNAAYKAAEKSAVLADAIFLGGHRMGVTYVAQLDSSRSALTVLNRTWRVPRSDSTLVVLVDRVDGVGGAPVVAGSIVVDGRVPDAPSSRTWTSGDTTFTIRAPDRTKDNVLTVLGRDSLAAGFWP